MPIRAIIFDMGGVLVRTHDPAPRQRLAARLGMTVEEVYRLVFESDSAAEATTGKRSADAHWACVQQALNLTPEGLQSFKIEFWDGDQVDYDLVNRLRGLRRSYKTALLSNAWDDLREIIVERWKISDAFDDLVISAEVGLAKPDPQIFHLALARLGIPAEEAVFVDDFAHNIAAAQQVGLQAVHFKDPAQTWAEVVEILNGRA